MQRRMLICSGLTIAILFLAGPALACGGLLSPNGSVNLLRTTTLAAYHRGVEHYVTSFRFIGGGGAKFGSIVPLPGIPSKVERGGDWTLQRLEREVNPPLQGVSFAKDLAALQAPSEAQVILQTRIDALDITVLKGGGSEVARWAGHHGFDLPPDAPEILDFYASRSPIFMAAVFDAGAARRQGLNEGDGTPIHVTIPTPAPWVPLRILGLGKKPAELIQADVFLLTDHEPVMLPAPVGSHAGLRPAVSGLQLQRSENASAQLMTDLRADKGMGWMPRHMWLSYITVNAAAAELRYDLALDVSGAGAPSYVAAGLTTELQHLGDVPPARPARWPVALVSGLGIATLGAASAMGVRRFVRR